MSAPRPLVRQGTDDLAGRAGGGPGRCDDR